MAEEDRAWLTGQDLPTVGRSLDELVHDVRVRMLPYPMGNGHPRFFGWVNSPPSPAGVLVASMAAALNPSCAGGEHAGALLEYAVVRWLADLAGYPHAAGGGLLTSRASMATIIGLASARQRAARQDGWDAREEGLCGQPPMVMYMSAEGHSCLRKAAELLGLGARHVRVVPVDGRFRMDVDALRALIAQDAKARLRPFCVAASAGTVNTGAVDPLEEIADVAADRGLWFHVDGAYGALGVLADGAAAAYAGIERADSLALDPHKWLGVPVDCGCVLLRAWATMSYLGRDGIVRLVNQTVRLAHALAAMIEAADDFELLAPVTTSIVAFRYRLGNRDGRVDDLNRAIPAAVQQRGRAFLTGTRIGGMEALRACFLNPATTTEDLSILLNETRMAAAEIAA
ncbi:pyridoxal phosphate-dependent decarboxylase family protein [Nonomuraea sp. NPDC049400]|uniref:pyridoxal phosphate-dependent decarboxylase family protein n=1 Tax=Nonomuraea sp. NPDC049400 TaxID=3364352 RepID=UPI0037B3B69C